MSDFAKYILVVDPSEKERQELVQYLLDKDYVVHAVATAEEAIQLVNDAPPSLLFADMSNLQLKEFVDKIDCSDVLPMVVVSEVPAAGDVVACLRAGASDFILKPIKDYKLVDHVIHGILDEVRLAEENMKLQRELEQRNILLKQSNEELSSDQKAGLRVQQKMMPQTGKHLAEVQFDYKVMPSLFLSGDFLDFFKLDDGRCLFYFADVSGHGISSAFATVLLKNLSIRLKRNYTRGSSDDVTNPARFLSRINQEVLASELGKHITVFVALFDVAKSSFTYSVGGHFPLPVLTDLSKNGVEASEYLRGKGPALGLFPDPQFEVFHHALPEQFQLTIFSDGILEVMQGLSLENKENLLLDVVSRKHADIESLLSSLGVHDALVLPDDIAVLTATGAKI